MSNQTNTRPIFEIAHEIRKDWGSRINYAAKPYLHAMGYLTTITDKYILDSAQSIILYFLANAGSWRGETAKRVKAELRQMVK